MDQLLLSFTDHCPIVDADLLTLDGLAEAENLLSEAEASGLVRPEGKGAVLTEEGKKRRNELLRQFGLPTPTTCLTPCDSLLTLNRCVALIGRSCKGDWGLADWHWAKDLPLACRARRPFTFSGSTPVMTWFDDPIWRQIRSLCPRGETKNRSPRWSLAEHLTGPVETLNTWRPQLLMLHHFDHTHYEAMSHRDTDELDMINCDRFFFSAGIETVAQAAEQAALLGQALATQWHLANPVLFDRAEDDIEQLNFWILVTETEKQRETLHRLLTPCARDLGEGAEPLMILTLSNQELRQPNVQSQTWCDWPGEVPHVLLPFKA